MAIRVLPVHAIAIDQVDFQQGDFFTRISGITTAGISVVGFYNNQPLNWTLVSGSGVADEQVVVGKVYFHEFQTGYYSFRFRPNTSGYWRFDVRYTAGTQSILLDYDIMDPVTLIAGLKASFVKPG